MKICRKLAYPCALFTAILALTFTGCGRGRGSRGALGSTTRSNLRQLQVCVLLYREDNGVWPGSFEDLSPYTKELSGGDEFNPTETISHDAWGNLTVMEPPTGEKGTGRLTSYGKDGKPGGEGMNADIVVEFSVVDVTGGKKTGK